MRKFLLILLLFLLTSTQAFANHKATCDGAFGLKWGDNQKQIELIAKKNEWIQKGNTVTMDASKYKKQIPGRILKPDLITHYYFKGFLNDEEALFSIWLDKNGLYSIGIKLSNIHPNFKPLMFESLLRDLSHKYGIAKETNNVERGYASWRVKTANGLNETDIVISNGIMGFNINYSLYRSEFPNL